MSYDVRTLDELRSDIAQYEAMKEGAGVRIADLEAEVKRLRNDWPRDHLPKTDAGNLILPRSFYRIADGDQVVSASIGWDYRGWTVTDTEGEEYSPDELFDALESPARSDSTTENANGTNG